VTRSRRMCSLTPLSNPACAAWAKRPRRAASGPQDGFMTMDALAGLFLLASLATLLVVALNLRHRAARELASQRDALHAAQHALQTLQTSRQLPHDGVIVIPSGHRLGERQWYQVAATKNGRSVSLFGLAPAGLVPLTTRPAGDPP